MQRQIKMMILDTDGRGGFCGFTHFLPADVISKAIQTVTFDVNE